MAIEVNVVLLDIQTDSTESYRIQAQTANDNANEMADSIRNSPMAQLDPNDGRKAIYTFSADISGVPKIGSQFLRP